MLTNKVSRTLRMMLVVMAVGMMLSVTGCSLFKKKAKAQVAAPAAAAQAPQATTPESVPSQHPAVGSTAEFPPEAGVKDVNFDFDKFDIKQNQLATLDKNLQYFKAHPEVKIMVEGNTDERGTVEYNFALGQRRAASVQDYLQKNGIAAERLATVSKGEENPVDPAKNEAAYAKNRRVHFMRMY